jgi:hypothetical protein
MIVPRVLDTSNAVAFDADADPENDTLSSMMLHERMIVIETDATIHGLQHSDKATFQTHEVSEYSPSESSSTFRLYGYTSYSF